MQIDFYKYQGTGNDFILIDNRNLLIDKPTSDKVARCCDRKFGIGADGLILLQNKEGFDFEMVYYNADGNIGSMCGNGARCVTAFANFLGITKASKAYFLAADGPHHAVVEQSNYIELKMADVSPINYESEAIFLDTGSPHHIEFIDQVKDFDVYAHGKAIRYSDTYKKEGTNVNFVEVTHQHHINVATYERGVEDETLSCGTGVTAAALAYHLEFSTTQVPQPVQIKTKGGELTVRFQYKNNLFHDIWLCGPAVQVFEGSISF